MLNLSELLLKYGDEIASFEELKTRLQKEAVETGSMHFSLDIEPPAYADRPADWYEQLEIAFTSAR
jgi:hypothetical protein